VVDGRLVDRSSERADGRTDGRAGGRTDGRTDGGPNWKISDHSLTVRGLYLDPASKARRAEIAGSEGCEQADNGGFGEAELDQRFITL
jgi:hypothetical protein